MVCKCSWDKVHCYAVFTHGPSLFASRWLSGTLPPWIGNFTKLERLNFGQTYLEGPFPEQIGNMKYLREVNLDGTG